MATDNQERFSDAQLEEFRELINLLKVHISTRVLMVQMTLLHSSNLLKKEVLQ